MPIVASRGGEIRRLLLELSDPKRRAAAVMRLRSLGSRVVPHVTDELGRLDEGARRALLDALKDVQTADAGALRKRLARAEAAPSAPSKHGDETGTQSAAGPESVALDALRALPPPRRDERASVSRERGEAHLALARIGSRLARKDLLLSLRTLGPDRTRLYCEAAGLIADAEFLSTLASLASVRPEAAKAIAKVAAREKITTRSRAIRSLDETSRLIVARSLAAG